MTNEEFSTLLGLSKVFSKPSIKLPTAGNTGVYDVESTSSNDRFFLDVDRSSRIELSKFKVQHRYAATKLPLVRIDINSPPHTNPDGCRLSRNHIHIYRETENDTGNLPWAYDLESIDMFAEKATDFMSIFYAFCEYCNISTDDIQGVL